MPDIRPINQYIWQASGMLTPEIPIHVHLVKGEGFAVWVDSGTKEMFPRLQAAMERAGVAPAFLRFVLHTHAHAHHIGSDGQLRRYTGCLIAAQSRYAHWHTDFERHYREYALSFPGIIADTPELRAEVLDPLDEEHPVDLHINETVQFDLGSAFLSGYRFSGHVASELAWFERRTRTFIFGDVITMLDTHRMHGHLNVSGYRDTLDRIVQLIDELEVQQILFSHYPPMRPDEAHRLVERARAYLDRLDTIVLNLITGHGELALKDLWHMVVETMGRQLDFRSLDTVHAHAQGLIRAGKVREGEKGVYCPVE